MEQYADVQQLMKKEDGQKDRKPVYPPTVIQAVFDGKTGASLEAILAQFNSVYVQYQGSPQATRNIIPEVMRRAGLTITYMDMESNTITERANSAVQKDNDHWGLDVNWSRVDELSLSGDISVSANGTWIINGTDTGVKAVGPKGDTGLTPWLKTIDNKLHFSYDNVTWEPCSENIAAWFRFNATSSDSQAGTIGRIQISRDNKTWTDLSPEFRNYLRVQGYVATTSALPANQVVGTIYGVGPTYAADDTAQTNPIYRLHVWNGTSWVDNGQFTSIAAGVVQETGDSETEVMSQKAVSRKLSELESNQNLIAFGDFEFPNDHSVKINKLYIFNTPNGMQTLYDDESVVRLHELNINNGQYGILVLHKDGKAEVVPNFVDVLSTDIVLLRYNYDVDGGISGGLLYRWYLKSITNTISQNANIFIGVDNKMNGYIRIAERENKRFLEWKNCFVGFRHYKSTKTKQLLLEESNILDTEQSIEIQSGVPFYINFSEWDVDGIRQVFLHHDNNFSSDSVILGIIGGSKEVLGLPLMELLFISDDVTEVENINIVKSLSHQAIISESKSYLLFDGKSLLDDLYLMSDFIPVKEGESYSYTGNVGALGVAIAGYSSNSENTFVEVILTNGKHNQKKVAIPSGVTHIRYCGRTDAILSFVPSILEMSIESAEVFYPILNYGYLDFEGKEVPTANYLMSDFIPVNEGEIFRYSGRCGELGVAIVGYSASEENAYLATLVTNGEFNNHEFTIPSGVTFIKVCGASELLGFNNPSLRKLVQTSSANISEWKDKNVVILGDSISTNDNNTSIERNTPEILITSEDVGKSLSAYLTYYDVQNGLRLGGHTFTSAEIGNEVSFVPNAEDVGKAIGLPNNYNPGNVVVWWEYLKERMGINPIPVCWSGSSITSHQENVHDRYKTSYAWHPAQLRKCGIRVPGTMERTAPDVIIIYRGTNDFSHSPYTKLTKDYFENIDLEIADTDVVEGGYGFKEGLCLTIKKMRELYPFAKIVLCTLNVFKRINYAHYPTNNGLNSLPQYNNAIREIADYMGCGLIEFDKDGITFENCYPTYISDSAETPTHPNNNGHYVMGVKALTDLKKL